VNQEQALEYAKIKQNPYAFLKYVKIQEPGDLAAPYLLWPHLIHFFRCLETYKFIDLLKSKQIGISWALAIHALRRIMTREGANVLEFSKGQTEARSLLTKSKVVYYNLPDWMKIYTVMDNADMFGFKELRSKITAYPSTPDAGIGETSDLVIHDEGDFHEFFETNLSHTGATVADGDDRQLVNVSTKDITKADNYWKLHFKDALDGKIGVKALFYPYNVRPDRDEEWYERMSILYKDTPWVVKANWPRNLEEALSPIAPMSCFNEDVMKILDANFSTEHEIRQNYIHILHPPRVGYSYCAGIDVGEGVGLDYSVLNIVGRYGAEAELCAVIYTNDVGTDSFAFDCEKLCGEYHYPILTVDNIGIGRAVIDKLVALGYPRLYKMKENKYGYALNQNNKRELVVKLVERINNKSLITRFKPQIKEMMEYQWVKGQPEPTGKTHGDTIIALMLAASQLDNIGRVEEAVMYRNGHKVR